MKFLLLLLLCASAPLLLCPPPARAAHVYFNLADFGLDVAAHSNRITRLIPQSTPRVNGSTIISSEARSFTNSSTATFLASNLVTGVYKVELPGKWTTTSFNILVPDTALTYNAATLITTSNSIPSASVGYSAAAADARFVNLTNHTATNIVVGTNYVSFTNECHTVANANTNVLIISGAGTASANGVYTQAVVGVYIKAATHGIYTDGIDWMLTNSSGTLLYAIEGDSPSGSAWSITSGSAPAPTSVFDSLTNCIAVPFWGGYPQDASRDYVNSNTARGIFYANRGDNLSQIWTNLPNDSELRIGSGNWTNRMSWMFGGGPPSGLFSLLNKTNIKIEFGSSAWLWNTNVGDGIQLSNCSGIEIVRPNIYGFRSTNLVNNTGFAAVCICACNNIKITRGNFINAGNWTEAEAETTGATCQSTNVEVAYNYHFNCGSWFGGGLGYDGGGTLPGSYWNVHHNYYGECARPIELYGQPSVPVVIGNRIENNFILNPISYAIWDSGATNNWYHIIRGNMIHIEDRFRTVSSNATDFVMKFAATRGFLMEDNHITGGAVALYINGNASFKSWDFTFRNNCVTNTGSGIVLNQGGSDSPYRGINISGNIFSTVQNATIAASGTDGMIENNDLVDCAVAAQTAIWAGVPGWPATNITVRNNRVRTSPGITPAGAGIAIDTGCQGCSMYDNEVSTAYTPRFSDSGAGTLWTSGVKAKNGGTNVVMLTGTKTIDFGSIAVGGVNTNHITVTGAGIGDPCFLGAPTNALISAAACTGLVFSAAVYVSNTVQVTVGNLGGAACDPGSGVYRVTVLRWNGDR